jgi:hypothetical protein
VDAALTAPAGSGPIAAAGAAGVLLLMAGVALGQGSVARWGVGVVAATYVGALVLRPEAGDLSGVLAAAALLGAAELSSWSIDSRRRGLDDLTVHFHRLRAIALVLAIGIGLAAVVEGAAYLGSGGTVLVGLASAGVVAGVAVTCVLVWRGAAARA